MRFRTIVMADGREADVVEGVRWAKTGERGIIINGLFIAAPDLTRAEAGARLGARMTELMVTREAGNAREALLLALAENPAAARAYCGPP
jgi:hypothetical protein